MITDEDRRFLLELIRRHAGIAIEPNQAYLVDCRLGAVANRHRLPSVAALVSRLRLGAPALAQEVVDALCTNETSFFRDGHPFDTLVEHVVPALAERRRARRTLHIWCAACSSGQEVWSTAIAIRERIDVVRDWTIRIVATDVSQQMVERTRAGLYSDHEISRGMPPNLVGRYLQRSGSQWQIRPELRAMVEVARANLLDPAPGPTRFDLIMLRNVLIYFDADGKRRVLDRIHHSLAADGHLMVGTGENLLDPRYESRVFGRTFVYSPRSGVRASIRPGIQEFSMISAAVLSSSGPNPWIVAARAAIIELTDQALGLGCKVVDTPAAPAPMMGALIPISSDMAPVQIGLFGSEATCMRLGRALLGNGPDDAMSRADMIDAMREIVNMFAGSVKARVARYATHAALGLPTFVHGPIEATNQQIVDRISVTVDEHEAQIIIARTAD